MNSDRSGYSRRVDGGKDTGPAAGELLERPVIELVEQRRDRRIDFCRVTRDKGMLTERDLERYLRT